MQNSSNTKTILFLINTFSVGGIEKHLSILAPEIAKFEKFKVKIAFLRLEDNSAPSLVPFFLRFKNIEVHDLKIQRLPNIFNLIKAFLKIYSLRPQIIHSMGLRTDLLTLFYSFFDKKVYKIFTIHDTALIAHHRSPLFHFLVNILGNFLYTKSNINVCISKVIANKMKLISPKADFNKIINYGITKKKLENKDTNIFFRNDQLSKIKICLIGRYDLNKNQILLAKAIEKCNQNVLDKLSFIVCGHDDYNLKSDLISKVRLSNNVDIRYLDFVENIHQLISESDYVLSTSLNEGLGLIAIEALSLGKPLIVPNAGAFPEYIHNGINGILYEKNNPKSLNESFIQIIKEKNIIPKEKIIESFENNFSLEIMINKYLEIYEKSFDYKNFWAEKLLISNNWTNKNYKLHQKSISNYLLKKKLFRENSKVLEIGSGNVNIIEDIASEFNSVEFICSDILPLKKSSLKNIKTLEIDAYKDDFAKLDQDFIISFGCESALMHPLTLSNTLRQNFKNETIFISDNVAHLSLINLLKTRNYYHLFRFIFHSIRLRFSRKYTESLVSGKFEKCQFHWDIFGIKDYLALFDFKVISIERIRRSRFKSTIITKFKY